MIGEKIILKNMNNTVNIFLTTLSQTKCNIYDIKNDANNLNNNYFLEDKDNIFNKLVNLFDEEALNDLIKDLHKFNTLIIEKIYNCCNHEWIEDLIDLNPDQSQTITYCRLCEISKKI